MFYKSDGTLVSKFKQGKLQEQMFVPLSKKPVKQIHLAKNRYLFYSGKQELQVVIFSLQMEQVGEHSI
jgi:hypothetical protein